MEIKTAKELKGTNISAKVKLHNYRFPRSGHKSGDWAIVIFDVIRILEGEIPAECELKKTPGKYQIVACGNLPKLDDKTEYIFFGTLIIDREWGPQYKADDIHLDYDLSRPEDQKKFFSYFMSERQIEALFSCHANPVQLLKDKNLSELMKVKGIGPATAYKMCVRYEESKHNSRAYVTLKDLELSKRVIDRLISFYGSADTVVNKIEENPYILIKEVRGIGWKKADDFAKRQGMANNCKERVIAYTRYYLEQQAEINGNTWIDVNDLILNIQEECQPITKEIVGNWLREYMIGETDYNKYYDRHSKNSDTEDFNFAFLYYDKNTRRVSLIQYRTLEKDIASNLNRLQSCDQKINFNRQTCESIIGECEVEQGYEYTEEQKQAIWSILESNVSILTGLAGTGKSSTLKPLVRIFRSYDLKVEQCALSGRASSLLTEYTGLTGKTIHRLLNYLPDSEDFKYSARNQMPQDVFILDETSMVGGELFLSLISAIKTGSKLIMLGDVHQLESIGLANILKDCISSGTIKTNVLTQIHRQAARSGIITQSLQIAEGKSIIKNSFRGEEIRGELKDFKIIGIEDRTLIQNRIIQEFKKLYIEQKISIDDIQVIVPMKTRGDNSCKELNTIIQQIVNPATSNKDVLIPMVENGVKYQVCFKPNDKVIVVKNNYHAEGIDGTIKQIFNGNMGKIIDINDEVMIVSIADVGEIVLPKDQWSCIQLAYAITVHKKQGDSVPYAILGLDMSAYPLLSKELVYTAITRARSECVLICQPSALNMAVRTSKIKIKQTWLADDLLHDMISVKSS